MKMIPKTGELYKDFTDKIYQVITVAVHAETGEQIVVYQAMSGDYGVYARSLQHFTGEDGRQQLFQKVERAGRQPAEDQQGGNLPLQSGAEPACSSKQQSGSIWEQPENVRQSEKSWKQERQTGYAAKAEPRPRTQSPAESKRVLRQSISETSGEGTYYDEKRRRQMEEREQRREMFRRSERHESATEELRANPCLIKFLEADTYEEKFHVLNEIQNDMTDRLIDDIAVVLDVVIPEGALNDRFHQLRNIILTRQKYETNRFR